MTCQQVEQLLDDFHDGKISLKTKRQINAHLESCSNCHSLYNNYQTMLDSLHRLEVHSCPDEIVENVYAILNLEKGAVSSRQSFVDLIFEYVRQYRFRLGIVGAVAVIILSLMISDVNFHQPPQIEKQYSETEIEQAKDQVKLALAFFNEITGRTQKILEEQVLPQQVIQPLKTSLKTAIKPLLNGGKS